MYLAAQQAENSKPGLLTDDYAMAWSRTPITQWHTVRASLVFAPEGSTAPPSHITLITCKNPRLTFAHTASHYHPPKKPRITIGHGCKIHPTAVLGSEGFGYEWDNELHEWVTFPHYGGVTIGDNVHIGANTCIDRGALTNTTIGHGVRIDNLVHIAHGVTIHNHACIIAGAEISGSCTIGKRAWIGPNACIREGITIGEGALIGIGSTVVKDVPPHTTVCGNPARPMQ